MNRSLRHSKFASSYRSTERYVVFHRLTLNSVLLNESAFKIFEQFKEPKNPMELRDRDACRIVQKLEDQGILVDSEAQDEMIENRASMEKPESREVKFVVTDKCNFTCRYCIFLDDAKRQSCIGHMRKKTVDRTFEALKGSLGFGSDLTFDLYGGEPLLNLEIIDYITEKIRCLESTLSNRFLITLTTNGSLIDQKAISLLVGRDVKTSVSIDGPQRVHNRMRIFRNKKGSFNRTIRGYWRLKRTGVNVGVAATIGSHNVFTLEKIVEYFASRLDADSIYLGLLTGNRTNPAYVDPKIVAEKLIDAYETARMYGIHEGTLVGYLNHVALKRPRIVHCKACGYRIVVDPKGDIFPCQAFLNTGQQVAGNISNINLLNNQVMQKWARRNVFSIEKCRQCYASPICGGGCAYSSFIAKGGIEDVNLEECIIYKTIMNWIMTHLSDGNKRPDQLDQPSKSSSNPP